MDAATLGAIYTDALGTGVEPSLIMAAPCPSPSPSGGLVVTAAAPQLGGGMVPSRRTTPSPTGGMGVLTPMSMSGTTHSRWGEQKHALTDARCGV